MHAHIGIIGWLVLVKSGVYVPALRASTGAVWCILQNFFMAVQVSICVRNIIQQIIWVGLDIICEINEVLHAHTVMVEWLVLVKSGVHVHALTASSGAVWCILQNFFMAVQVSI